MWLTPGPWTHHPRSSPSHLQLLEEVLQLLPLDVSITLEQRDHNCMLMQHHKWHCFSVFLFFTSSADVQKVPKQRHGHSVKQIPTWPGFALVLIQTRAFKQQLSSSPSKRFHYWPPQWSLFKRLCVHKIGCQERLYMGNNFSLIFKVMIYGPLRLFSSDQ